MKIQNKLGVGGAAFLSGALLMASVAFAIHSPEHYSLFGDASYVSPGNASSSRAVHLQSSTSTTPGYGGISYGVEAGTTFASLTTLSSDFRVDADDSCVGGSPRFSIGIDTDGNGTRDGSIFLYFGIDSAGAPCIPGTWQNTGDFLEAGRLVDSSQLPGGNFYDPYDLALAKYGTSTVTSISAVVDASWAAIDGEQGTDIDNTLINTTLFTYEVPVAANKDECKNGGWMTLADDQGHSFKNQGDCVSFVASQGKNKGSGN